MIALLLASLMVACGGSDEGRASTDGERYIFVDPTPQIVVATVGPTATAEPVAVDTLDPAVIVPARRRPTIISERPHATDAFTQGLFLDNGKLYESTGAGLSDTGLLSTSVRIVDPLTGKVEQKVETGPEFFGEGLTRVDDLLIQLTWQNQVAFLYDAETLEKVGEFQYDTEGWGLCYDGDRLIMSDGSSWLTFRDPTTFAPQGQVEVMLNGVPLPRLNELECVDGRVWANVWLTDLIVEIAPETGAVVTVVDASGLLQPRPVNSGAVLNGIAFDDATGNFLVTGKMWPVLYEVSFAADETPADVDGLRPPTPIPADPSADGSND